MIPRGAAGVARFDNVNLLRAFAALAVVVYHVIEHAGWQDFPASGPLLTFRIGWIGVDLFFVISGFVIAYSSLAAWRRAPARFARAYWRRRLARILPLYLLTLALWMVFFRETLPPVGSTHWFAQLVSHLTFTHSFWSSTHGTIDGPNWSLAIEMQFYLMVALLIGWIDRTPAWRILAYGILVAWAYRAWIVLVAYPHESAALTFLKSTQLPGTLDEFAAGIFLAKLVVEGRMPNRFPAVAGLCVAAGLVGWLTMTVFWKHARYWDEPAMVIFWRTPFAIFLATVVACAVALPQWLAHRWLRPLHYLGEISYGIYLWHLFAIMAAAAWLGRDGAAMLPVVLAATLGAAMLSWHLVEKPAMQWAHR